MRRLLFIANVIRQRGYDVNERKVEVRVHGVQVAHPRDLLTPDGTPLLVAVGAKGARATIRPQLESRGYEIGGNAWFVS